MKAPPPLALLAFAAAGLLLMKGKAAPVHPRDIAVQTGAQTYATPTSIAQALGAFVAAYTKGATPTTTPQNIVGFDWQSFATNANQAGADWTAANPELGVFTFGAGGPNNDPTRSWTPSLSDVSVATSDNLLAVDGTPAGAIYNVGTDYTKNPFAALGM